MTANDTSKVTVHYCKECGKALPPSGRRYGGRHCALGPLVGDGSTEPKFEASVMVWGRKGKLVEKRLVSSTRGGIYGKIEKLKEAGELYRINGYREG